MQLLTITERIGGKREVSLTMSVNQLDFDNSMDDNCSENVGDHDLLKVNDHTSYADVFDEL